MWNRPIYDDADGGMLRVEMRSLPAGPTAVDMVANAAFLIGLAEGIRPRIHQLLSGIPFAIAEYNFYRAAQHGLDAKLVWPEFDQSGYGEQPVCAIIEKMLPLARQGLDRIGVAPAESERYLGVIQHRLERRQTGAIWQQKMLAGLGGNRSREAALHQLLEVFIKYSTDNQPVADWPL